MQHSMGGGDAVIKLCDVGGRESNTAKTKQNEGGGKDLFHRNSLNDQRRWNQTARKVRVLNCPDGCKSDLSRLRTGPKRSTHPLWLYLVPALKLLISPASPDKHFPRRACLSRQSPPPSACRRGPGESAPSGRSAR